MHLRETGKKRQHEFLLKGLSFRLLFLPLSLFPFLLSSLNAGEGIGSFELLAPSHGQALGFCSVLGPGKTGSVEFAFRGAGLWNPPILHSLTLWCVQPFLLVKTRSEVISCLSGCGLNPDLGAPMGSPTSQNQLEGIFLRVIVGTPSSLKVIWKRS